MGRERDTRKGIIREEKVFHGSKGKDILLLKRCQGSTECSEKGKKNLKGLRQLENFK